MDIRLVLPILFGMLSYMSLTTRAVTTEAPGNMTTTPTNMTMTTDPTNMTMTATPTNMSMTTTPMNMTMTTAPMNMSMTTTPTNMTMTTAPMNMSMTTTPTNMTMTTAPMNMSMTTTPTNMTMTTAPMNMSMTTTPTNMTMTTAPMNMSMTTTPTNMTMTTAPMNMSMTTTPTNMTMTTAPMNMSMTTTPTNMTMTTAPMNMSMTTTPTNMTMTTTPTNMTMTTAPTNMTMTTTLPATTEAPPLTPNTTVEILETPVSRVGCGTTVLCGSEPSDCDPSSSNDCFFASAKQRSGQNFDFNLSGQSDGYIAATLSSDNTVGNNDTTYVCANKNGTVVFIGSLLNNDQLSETELNVNSVRGKVTGRKIQCTFAATVRDTQTRATGVSVSIFTGSFNSTSGALGSPTAQFMSPVVNLADPNATLTNELANNATTTAPPTGNAITLQQSLTQALLISMGMLGLLIF